MVTVDGRSRISCLITGRVQGVGFRATVWEVAQSLSLSGWVRNLVDGRVELLAEGPEGDVLKLVSWAWTGSEGARVDNVEVRRHTPGDMSGDFRVLPTSREPAVPDAPETEETKETA